MNNYISESIQYKLYKSFLTVFLGPSIDGCISVTVDRSAFLVEPASTLVDTPSS